jgi:hypothetical protein
VVRFIWVGIIAISLLAIGYQIVKDWKKFRAYPWQLRWQVILLAFGVYSLSIFLTSLAWSFIMRRLSGNTSMRSHMRIFCLTNLARRLPTLFPYIGARTEAYAARGLSRKVTLLAIAIEMTTMTIGALIVSILTLPVGPYPLISAQIPKLALLLLVLPVLLTLFPKYLFAIINSVLSWLNRPSLEADVDALHMFLWTGLFVAIWVNGGLLYYLLASSIYPISPDKLLFVINVLAITGVAGWIGQVLFFLPMLPLRQLMFAYLLSLADIPFSAAVAIAIGSRLCVMGFEMIWAILVSIFL